MWTTMWVWPYPTPPVPRPPSLRERILSRVRHASFSESVAERLVADLTRRQLKQLWGDTTRLLEQPLRGEARLNVVIMRDHLLRRLESLDPGGAERWVRTGRATARRPHRSTRP